MSYIPVYLQLDVLEKFAQGWNFISDIPRFCLNVKENEKFDLNRKQQLMNH